MIKSSNKNLINAVNSFKVDKSEKRDYVRYIVAKEGAYYITNSKILFRLPCNDDTVVDGYYRVLSKTKNEISFVKIAEHENNLPDYGRVLNDMDGYFIMTDIKDACGINYLAFSIATKYNACFDFKYLQVICDMRLYTELLFKDNKNPVKVINDDFKIAIMPMRVED